MSQAKSRVAVLRAQGGFFSIGPKAAAIVTGSDSVRYLNGQLTIDITRLAPSIARGALLLTAKGKIGVPVFVSRQSEGFLLEAPAELRETLIARLERYIIADDVVVTDASDRNPGFHRFGVSQMPATINRIGLPGTDTATKPDDLREITSDEIELLRVAAGIPSWGRELDDDTLVQEARLEATCVDFDKGCYVGQEVVSRLKSVGRVNRRLFGFVGTEELSILQPLQLVSADDRTSVAGTLTSTARDFELARTLALGYLHRNFETRNRFLALNADGQVLAEFEKSELPIP